MPEARRSVESDRKPIVAMWVEAFAADPGIRWFLPDDATYVRKATPLFGYIFDVRHHGGEVWVRDALAAAAWTPPGGLRPMNPTAGQRWAQVGDHLTADELERVEIYGDALDPLLPQHDNWYLGALGTAPASRGKGHGRAVIQPILERADAAGIQQSLETSVPGNVDLYRRWGFEVTGDFTVAGSPLAWVMVRQPGGVS